MAFNPTLRLNKGTELSWQELDDNFSQIAIELTNNETAHNGFDARILALEGAGAVLPTATAAGQLIYWDAATQWTAGDHNDILPTGSFQHALMWDTSTSTWTSQPVPSSLPVGATGDILVYDGTTWQPQAPTSSTTLPTGSAVNDVMTWDGANWISAPAQDNELPTTANTGDVITWNGTSWVAAASVSLPTTANTGDVITWNGTSWIAAASVSLPDGTSNNNTLQWDGTAWVPVSNTVFTGNATFNSSITEKVYTASLTGTVALDSSLGTIWDATLTGKATLTDNLTEGQSMILHVAGSSSFTIVWPAAIIWLGTGGFAPKLATTGWNSFSIYKAGGQLYVSYLGNTSTTSTTSQSGIYAEVKKTSARGNGAVTPTIDAVGVTKILIKTGWTAVNSSAFGDASLMFEGSNDGINWTTIQSQSLSLGSGVSGSKVYQVYLNSDAGDTVYDYYRSRVAGDSDFRGPLYLEAHLNAHFEEIA